jgi:hypothetical protein
MRPPRALPVAHFDRNERYAYFGDRTPIISTFLRRFPFRPRSTGLSSRASGKKNHERHPFREGNLSSSLEISTGCGRVWRGVACNSHGFFANANQIISYRASGVAINALDVAINAPWSLANFEAVFCNLTGEDARPTFVARASPPAHR